MTSMIRELPMPERARFRAQEGQSLDTDQRRVSYHDRLLSELETADPFPSSDQPVNESLDGEQSEQALVERYHRYLTDYETQLEDAHPEKIDFLMMDNINVGHKVHLNVPDHHVKTVSDYLIRNGYKHKYLHGGEIRDGKIFTVYFGSLDKTKVMSEMLSRDLHETLRRPVATDEVEYAPNVAGRFVGGRKDFQPYGHFLRGLPVLVRDFENLDWEVAVEGQKPSPDESRRLFENAFAHAADKYGNYFYGNE